MRGTGHFARRDGKHSAIAWVFVLTAGYAVGCAATAPDGGFSGLGGQSDDGGSAPAQSTPTTGDAGIGTSSGGVADSSASTDAGRGTVATGGGSDGGHAEAGAKADSGPQDGGGLMGIGDAGGACPAPSGITPQQTTALQIINSTRSAMGSPCATMVPTLNTSATKHCTYYAANASNMMCVSNAHLEVSGCTDFVGADPGTREMAAGYSSYASSEVMAFDDDPTAAFGQWLGSIYHRTPVLDPWTRDFGYGNATMCDTVDFGVGAGSSTPANLIVSYPYDGQTGVATSFYGMQEIPQPPVPPNGWPSGLPVHVFMQASSITLTTDEFSVDSGAMLAHQNMLPQSSQGYLSNALVLYANSPLSSQTKYRVHVAGTRMTQSFTGTSSAQFDVSFAFTTQ